MTHEAIALKYRPRTFDDVVGQQAIVRTLRNAVKVGRVASVSIFAGPHGVGKTTTARLLARALNCDSSAESDGNPCNTCSSCQAIARTSSPDVIEIDAASHNGVNEIRPIRDNVRYRPAHSQYKVWILDEAHQLSNAAFNALLKTFEEPPDHARFVLATTELAKLPVTIRSRAQVFEFRRVGPDAVKGRLESLCEAEKIETSAGVLELIARRTRGSVRDAEKILDQARALSGGELLDEEAVRLALGIPAADLVDRALRGLAGGAAEPVLETVRDLYLAGADPHAFVSELLEALRGLVYLGECGRESPALDELLVPLEQLERLSRGDGAISPDVCLLMLQVLNETRAQMRSSRDERIILEVALVRLCRSDRLLGLAELVARFESLERRLGGGSGGPAERASDRPPVGPGGGGSRPRVGGQGSGGPARSSGKSSGASGPASRVSAGERRSAPSGDVRPAPRGHAQVQQADGVSNRRAGGPAVVSLEALREVWHESVADLRTTRSQEAGRAWRFGYPESVEGDRVLIGLESLPAFYDQVVDSHEERRALGDVLAERLGCGRLEVGCVRRSQSASGGAGKSGAAGASSRSAGVAKPQSGAGASESEPVLESSTVVAQLPGRQGRLQDQELVKQAMRELGLVPVGEGGPSGNRR